VSRSCESAAQSIEAAAWMARSSDGRACSGQSHCFSLWASASESFSSWGIPSKRIFRMAWGTISDVNGATTFIEKRDARWGSTPAPGLLHKYNPFRFRYLPGNARNEFASGKPSDSSRCAGLHRPHSQSSTLSGPLTHSYFIRQTAGSWTSQKSVPNQLAHTAGGPRQSRVEQGR
jgi:hypothetical protein